MSTLEVTVADARMYAPELAPMWSRAITLFGLRRPSSQRVYSTNETTYELPGLDADVYSALWFAASALTVTSPAMGYFNADPAERQLPAPPTTAATPLAVALAVTCLDPAGSLCLTPEAVRVHTHESLREVFIAEGHRLDLSVRIAFARLSVFPSGGVERWGFRYNNIPKGNPVAEALDNGVGPAWRVTSV